MTRVARQFEDLLLAVRSSVATQRPVSCELLDNLIVKTKTCFDAQKRTHNRGLYSQILIPLVGTMVGISIFKAEASTSLQFSGKVGDYAKNWFDAGAFDQQAMQKQIDNATAELTASNQSQATFLQSLESAMQRNQQILDNAKR
jgi:hypothetical protein